MGQGKMSGAGPEVARVYLPGKGGAQSTLIANSRGYAGPLYNGGSE